MSERDDETLGWLAAIAAAIAGAHTELTLGARLADALSRELPLVSLTLAHDVDTRVWPGGSAAREVTSTQRLPLANERSLVLALAGPPVAPALAQVLGALADAGLAQVDTLARVATLSRRALGDREALRAELARRDANDHVVARSRAMRTLFEETIPRVACEDVTVLVRGETGTGKEVVARRIHALSRRARRPLVVANCGALPETLAESALFGHERGAFTGAQARHVGLFERAHGATLLLDEIGELTPSMQARLLRVLERGELERVGGTAVLRVDVRLIAATHRPLEAMVAEGTFREDLFYRVAVVPIALPPLRERPEDLPALVVEIVRELAERRGIAPPHVAPDALERLLRWPWPGNVRELRNLLERAIVLGRGDTLQLPRDWDRSPPAVARAETFDDAQRRILRDALDACEGRIYGATGAAARLGLAPTTLRSKLEKLGLASWRVE